MTRIKELILTILVVGGGERGERMFTKLHSELQMFSSQTFCPSGGGG